MTVPVAAAAAYHAADTLEGVIDAAILEPLPAGDERYVLLTEEHRATNLKRLRLRLRRAVTRPDQAYLKLVLTGHRGCGKTTELLRLEEEFKGDFHPLHLTLDRTLYADFDYSLMLLWLAEELGRHMAAEGLPLDQRELDKVGLWFAERTRTEVGVVKAEAIAGLEGKAGAEGGGWSVLARLRMQVAGSKESRTEIKTRLRNSGEELLGQVNALLAAAESALAKAGRPSRILIVQDNLDKMERDAARAMFGDGADFLHRIQADCIFTAPIAQSLAPVKLRNQFPDCYQLPTLTVCGKDGTPCEEGVSALADLLRQRADLNRIFDGPDTWRRMCQLSGGSVRDLMRLLGLGADLAEVMERPTIDADVLDQAAAQLRKDFQTSLVPARAYYPRLARIHCDHNDGLVSDDDPDNDAADKDRKLFCDMLINGAVLEYENGDVWYGVHPLVQQIGDFQKALNGHVGRG